MINVKVHLKETSQQLEHDADNAYQKGDLYCVKVGGIVYKYPIADIWRVTEEYS